MKFLIRWISCIAMTTLSLIYMIEGEFLYTTLMAIFAFIVNPGTKASPVEYENGKRLFDKYLVDKPKKARSNLKPW
ncbi:hypothetical protein [Pseudoalteromonas luteoviolacea]|uniref:Uncharacterized protein n=1 Tax=Pseudoalteromonas luteoviolacea NCIMB 1942 TaxID=1365253 RepID=A0A161YEF6_9GAMM|nr:hypothetical protein [Pseudoalteromonas luteoviolacea]KZN58546.1 hypothetical protein N482_21695 [Pseudoalteromonas luteoviolacea NCIMB 1942]KZX01564.1 hypothetical protein JL49_05505 [Pseudoalteromonas luteoviolacea]